MSEQQGRQSQSHGNGHGGLRSGLNDGDEDYDGGLRAAAEGGRVAVFRGAGRPVQQQQAPEVDSPFLGLFDAPSRRARPEPPPPPPISGIPVSGPPTATPEDLRPPARDGFDLRQPVERAPYDGSMRSNGGGAPLVAVPADQSALVRRELPIIRCRRGLRRLPRLRRAARRR